MSEHPYLKTNDEVDAFAGFGSLANSREIKAVVLRVKEQAEREQKADPQRSDVFREDVAYKMGVVEGIERILDLEAQARAIAQRAEQHGRG